MAEIKKYPISLTVVLECSDNETIDRVMVEKFQAEKVPLPIFTRFMGAVSSAQNKQKPDSDLDCDDFEKGTPEGRCDGMGHYLCDECKYRSQESIRQKHEEFLHRKNYYKKDRPMIRARVIDSGEEVMVDDFSIEDFGTSYYNMWHNTESGITYHDDDLEFIDERLQKID